MTLILRADQRRMFDESRAAFRAGAWGVLNVAPTGAGKGRSITHWLCEIARHGQRAAVAVHLREIALDIAARLRAELPGITIRILIGAEDEGDADAAITIGTWQTLSARRIALSVGWFLVDEAHRTSCATAQGVLEAAPGARLLGFTATGQRGDGSGLGPAGYQVLVQGPQIAELVDGGHLSPVRVFAPDEFTEGLAQDPVAAIRAHLRAGDSWIVYGSSLAHSHHIAAALQSHGVRAQHVDSDSKPRARAAALSDLESGALDVLTCFRLFVEGINIRRVNGVALASAFSHDGPYLQAIGRGRRALPGKASCTVLDLRGNIHRRGHPDEDRTYHLDGRAVRRAGALTPVMCCRACLGWFSPRPRCPMCGAAAPPPKPPRLTKAELREQRQERTPRTGPAWELWQSLVTEGRARGFKPQWPALRFKAQTGSFPPWGARQVPLAPEPAQQSKEASRVA